MKDEGSGLRLAKGQIRIQDERGVVIAVGDGFVVCAIDVLGFERAFPADGN
jgi:hypothetical protein